jgi:carbonic anhydrase
LNYAQAARKAAPGGDLLELTQQNVLAQLDNLRTHPSVAARLEEGDLELHGWVYHIGEGAVTSYDGGSGRFLPVTALPVRR